MARAKKETQAEVPVREVKTLTLKQELGRRRNNKSRPAGEKVATKAFYLGAMSRTEIDTLLEGGEVTKSYGSGRTERYVLATS